MSEENKARIPVTPSVKQIVKDYANGLGATYSQTMLLLIDVVKLHGETPFDAGRRMRKEFQKEEAKS